MRPENVAESRQTLPWGLRSGNETNPPTVSLGFMTSLYWCHEYGQAYDGASTMSGHVSGIAARIQEVEPTAIYVHCLQIYAFKLLEERYLL